MKDIFTIQTSIGNFKISKGEFMPGDGRKNKYHGWWDGSGISVESASLPDAKKQLIRFIREELKQKMGEYQQGIFSIQKDLEKVTTKEIK